MGVPLFVRHYKHKSNQLPEPSHGLYHVYDDDIIFRHNYTYKYVCVYNIWYILGWSILIYFHPRFFLNTYNRMHMFFIFTIFTFNTYIRRSALVIYIYIYMKIIYIYIYLCVCLVIYKYIYIYMFEFHIIYIRPFPCIQSLQKKRTGREQWSSPR